MKTKHIDTLKEILNALKIQQGMIKTLKASTITLCEISDISYNCYNEILEKGKTSYPLNIGKKELIARYNFFGTMLGLVDAKIDSLKPRLDSNNRAVELEYSKLLVIREKILNDIKALKLNFRGLYQEDDYMDYASLKLNILIDDKDSESKKDLLNSYDLAYKNSKKININNIYDNYKTLYDTISKKVESNNYKKSVIKEHQKVLKNKKVF